MSVINNSISVSDLEYFTFSNADFTFDTDFTFNTSSSDSDSNITWHFSRDVNGNIEYFYTELFPIIGFRPSKSKTFISENNTSEILIFGTRHEAHN